MAIGHLNTKPVQRSKGQSAVHAAAYMTRSRLRDERMGRVWDYSRKAGELLFTGLYLPREAPAWMNERTLLWNAAERAERRVNSRTARAFDVALPHELTDEQNRWLVQDFVRENFQRKGIAAEVTIHRPGREGDERNVHAHILITVRTITADGFGQKNREIDRRDTLKHWRQQWEHQVNRQLERHGHEQRISMRTLAEQGIDRTPGLHVGKNAMAQERKGVETDRGDEMAVVRRLNAARLVRELEADGLEGTVERLRREDRERELKRVEAELVRSARASTADIELLNAVRRLMVTMGGQMQAQGFERERLRGAGQQLRAEAVIEARQQPTQPREIRVADAAPAGQGRERRIEPGPIVPALAPALEPSKPEAGKRRTLMERMAGQAAKVKLEQDQPERRLERVLERGPRSRKRPEDEPK